MNDENTSWQSEPTHNYPPPERKPERRLSLKAAMALATGAPGHETLMPLLRKNDDDLASNEDSRKKVETYLLNLQADIINREELLEQRKRKLDAREKDLNNRSAVIEKKAREIESKMNKVQPLSPAENGKTAVESFEDTSEADLFEETRILLREREEYIQKCENALVEKLTQLTRREAEIETREEQLDYKARQLK
jgi:hypothetical protein